MYLRQGRGLQRKEGAEKDAASTVQEKEVDES
jgi:hypothetical protein